MIRTFRVLGAIVNGGSYVWEVGNLFGGGNIVV